MKIYVCVNFRSVSNNELTLLDSFNVNTEGVAAVPSLIDTFMQGQGVQPVDNTNITELVQTIIQQRISNKPEYMFESLPEGFALDFTIPEFLPGYNYAVDYKDNTLSVIFARKPKSSSEYNQNLEYTVLPAIEDFMVKHFELTEDQFKEAIKLCSRMYSGNIFNPLGKGLRFVFRQANLPGSTVTIEPKINCVVISAKPINESHSLQSCANIKAKINILNHILNNKSKAAYKTFLMKYAIIPNEESLYTPKKYPKLGLCVVKRIDGKATKQDDPHPIIYSNGESLYKSVESLYKYISYALGGKAKYISQVFIKNIKPKLDRHVAIIKEAAEKIPKNQAYREAKAVEESNAFMKVLSNDIGLKLTKNSVADAAKLGFDTTTFDEDFMAITHGEGNVITQHLQNLLSNNDFSSLESLLTKNNGLELNDTGLLVGHNGTPVKRDQTDVLDTLINDLSIIEDNRYEIDKFNDGVVTLQLYSATISPVSVNKLMSKPKAVRRRKVIYTGPSAIQLNVPQAAPSSMGMNRHIIGPPPVTNNPQPVSSPSNRAANLAKIQQRRAAMLNNQPPNAPTPVQLPKKKP